MWCNVVTLYCTGKRTGQRAVRGLRLHAVDTPLRRRTAQGHRGARSTVLRGPPWCAASGLGTAMASGLKSWCSRSKNIFSQLRRDGRLSTHFHGAGHHAARGQRAVRGPPWCAASGLGTAMASGLGTAMADTRVVTAPHTCRVGSPPHTHAPTYHLPDKIDGAMHTQSGRR